MKIFLIFLMSYFIGAIPSGYIISRYFFKTDITKYGSGNIGTTNVQRTLGIKPALLVFVLDVLEGFIPTIVALYVLNSMPLAAIAGAITILGHDYSIFMPHFKGGKGIATSLGVAIVLSPLAAVLSLVVFAPVLLITKYVSVGSIAAVIAFPILMFILKRDVVVFLISLSIPILGIISHRENIKRVLHGNEKKFGEKVKIDETH